MDLPTFARHCTTQRAYARRGRLIKVRASGLPLRSRDRTCQPAWLEELLAGRHIGDLPRGCPSEQPENERAVLSA